MDQGERLRYRSSFGTVAAAYAEHRPDYAQAAVRWVLEPALGSRVLDLAPGGVLGSLWNVIDDRVGRAAGLARVSGDPAIGPRDTRSSWRAATADMRLPSTGVARFGSPERAAFPHGQRRTADSLVGTIATRAGMLVVPDQGREATLGRIRAFLASKPETAHGEFTLPMLTGVLRVHRL